VLAALVAISLRLLATIGETKQEVRAIRFELNRVNGYMLVHMARQGVWFRKPEESNEEAWTEETLFVIALAAGPALWLDMMLGQQQPAVGYTGPVGPGEKDTGRLGSCATLDAWCGDKTSVRWPVNTEVGIGTHVLLSKPIPSRPGADDAEDGFVQPPGWSQSPTPQPSDSPFRPGQPVCQVRLPGYAR